MRVIRLKGLEDKLHGTTFSRQYAELSNTGAGTPLVFSNGGGLSQVVIYDLRGQGKSSYSNNETIYWQFCLASVPGNVY